MQHLGYGEQRKGGRPPWCPVLMRKVLVLQRFHGLSDEATEVQILDRLSFRRFLGLHLDDDVPDHTTIWCFKERLGSRGQIIDASCVEAPRQRNPRADNEQIKRGERPAHFDENRHRGSQKDTDARWALKGSKSHYGYKNHVKVDAASKLIETYHVTDTAVHDSQAVAELVRPEDHGKILWADSAYVGPEVAKVLDRVRLIGDVHEGGS